MCDDQAVGSSYCRLKAAAGSTSLTEEATALDCCPESVVEADGCVEVVGEVGIVGGVRRFEPVGFEETGDAFGVVFFHLTPEGVDEERARHRARLGAGLLGERRVR